MRSRTPGTSEQRWCVLELGDLVEPKLDWCFPLEERHQHRELTALGLDFANSSGKTRKGSFLDRAGFTHLEVHFGGKHSRDPATNGHASAFER